MKFIKKLGILLVTLVALILIISLFIEKDYHISRSVEVSMESDKVFDYLRYLESHDQFSIWPNKDPNIVQTFSGEEDGTIGAIYAWDSQMEDVGAGEQEIIKIDEGKQIDFELRFKRPWEMTSNAYFSTESVGGSSTKVTWGFKWSTPWPWNFFSLFMDMENELGTDLQAGLDKLKKILESKEQH